MTFLSIIIPTWNSKKTLPRTLECLARQTFRDFEVILVDNGSADYDQKTIEEYCRSFSSHSIHFKENTGFAYACNYGARLADGEWLAFLNADAFPQNDWLEQFQHGQKKIPQAAVFASFITQHTHPDLIDGSGDVYHISGNAWKRGYGYPVSTAPQTPERIFSPNAAAAFYRRDVFLQTGGFDEDFFSYFEDVDLGFRINLAGEQCFFLPSARVEHVGSTSTGSDSDFAVYHHHRNSDWAFLKNMPTALFIIYFPIRIIANLIFFLKYLAHGRGGIVLKAKWDAFLKTPSMLKKRRSIQRQRTARVWEINRMLNKELCAPFLLGRRLRAFNRKQRSMENEKMP